MHQHDYHTPRAESKSLPIRLNIHKPTTYVGREKGYSYNPRDIHRPMSELAGLFTSKAASAAARSSSPPVNRAGRHARISFAAIVGHSLAGYSTDVLPVPRVLFHRSYRSSVCRVFELLQNSQKSSVGYLNCYRTHRSPL